MVSDFLLVLVKIVSMFLVMLLGWVMRKREFLSADATGKLSRMLLVFVFPALVFPFMLKTITPETLRESWIIPICGIAIITITILTSRAASLIFCKRSRRGQFAFLAGSPNWIFLPLPIVEGLFHEEGVRAIFLYSAGAQLTLWTLGVSMLRGTRPDLKTLKSLLNPGLLAIFFGVVVSLCLPVTHKIAIGAFQHESFFTVVASSLLQASEMVGSLTIPLSLIVIGSRLGELKTTFRKPNLEYGGIMIARLALGPLVTVMIVQALNAVGIVIPETVRVIGYLISCMPIAITAIVFVEHYGGDESLSARAIFDSTLLSVVTVPVFYYIVVHFGL